MLMKLLVLVSSLVFIANSCGNIKQNPSLESDTTSSINDAISVTVKENTTYALTKDSTGSLYPLFQSGEATTLIFKYTEKGPEGTADGDYTETIHMMIPNAIGKGLFKDEQLQQAVMTFGKFCFCKGEAGYRQIPIGTLKYTRDNTVLHIETTFEVPGIEQKIKQLKKSITI